MVPSVHECLTNQRLKMRIGVRVAQPFLASIPFLKMIPHDLNRILYEELFDRKNRVNPNGCPILATFYISHEWTDYAQVQNLYADGHEVASHSISHRYEKSR